MTTCRLFLLAIACLACAGSASIAQQPVAKPVTFEFDSNNSVTETPTYRRVPFFQVGQAPLPSTPDEIAAAILTAILGVPAPGLALSPTTRPGGIVHLGSDPLDSVNVNNAPSLGVTGVAGGVEDGQYFTIRNDNGAVFEIRLPAETDTESGQVATSK